MILGFQFFLTCIDIHICAKTADRRYQEEHISNVLTNNSQINTARHLQVWQHFTELVWTFWISPSKQYYIFSFGFYLWSDTWDTVPNIQYEESYPIIQLCCRPSRSAEMKRPQNPRTIPCDCILWKVNDGWQTTTIFETDLGMLLIHVLDWTQIPRPSEDTTKQYFTYRRCTTCSLCAEIRRIKTGGCSMFSLWFHVTRL